MLAAYKIKISEVVGRPIWGISIDRRVPAHTMLALKGFAMALLVAPIPPIGPGRAFRRSA